ncbi:MAG: uracil-DNA glycosylase family protein [Caldilineaceae bacterium]
MRRRCGVPGVSAAGGLAGRGGCDQAARLSGLDVLGQARPRFWRPGGVGCSSWDWRRVRTGPIARGVPSPATVRAISSTVRFHAPVSPTNPTSQSRDDGLVLRDCFITSVGRCVPPQNRPTAAELANCRPFLLRELALLDKVQVVIALGHIAFDGYLGRCASKATTCPSSSFSTAPGSSCSPVSRSSSPAIT